MSWLMVAVGVAAVGTSISAYSAVAAGQNAKETADYNAKVQQNSALDAEQRGAQAAMEHQDKVRRLIGTQIADTASNGMMTNTGASLNILTDTAGFGKLDALKLLNNAGRQAQGYNDQAGLLKVQGDNASTAGSLNGSAAVLGGVSSGISGFYSTKAAIAMGNQG